MATLKAKYGTEEEVNLGAVTGITAAAGGQGAATQLTKKWSEVTTNPAGGGVKLSAMKIGSKQVVFNNTAEDLIVYPTVGESINGIVNYNFVVGFGQVMTFESHKTGFCFSYGSSL